MRVPIPVWMNMGRLSLLMLKKRGSFVRAGKGCDSFIDRFRRDASIQIVRVA
jgi:hypothetical protein